MQVDQSQDYKVWDLCTQITFASSRGHGFAPDTFGVGVAKFRALTTRELAASNGVYTGTDRVCLIPDALLPATIDKPKPADLITDLSDLSEWTVLEVQLGKNRQTHRCTCRNMTITYKLRDIITIERSTRAEDAAGATVRNWQPLYVKISARVQPKGGTTVTERGVRGQEGDYEIHVAKQLPLMNARECRVNWVSNGGLILDVEQYQDAEQIGALPMIDAKLRV